MDVVGVIALAVLLTACLAWLWRSTPAKAEHSDRADVGQQPAWIEPKHLGYGAQFWLLEALERRGSRSAERAGEDRDTGVEPDRLNSPDGGRQ